MTDKEIIKALECCAKCKCGKCPYVELQSVPGKNCVKECTRDTIALIAAQKSQIEDLYIALDDRIQRIEALKAEVKRLTSDNERIRRDTILYCDTVREYYESLALDARADAIREFAEKMNPMYKVLCVDKEDWYFEIDTLVKEMMEGGNA